jgi:hypothetical protein
MMDLSPTIMDALLPVLWPLILHVKEKYGGKFGSPTGSSVKVHFMSTQFVGGMQYISRNFILPFEPYRSVMEEGK